MIRDFQNSLRLQKIKFFGTNFLCNNSQPILKKIIASSGRVEYISAVQNRSGSATDSEILIESFSDEEDNNNKKAECDVAAAAAAAVDDDHQKNSAESSNVTGNGEGNDECAKLSSPPTTTDLKSHNDAAEIRRLLRRKDELERKQKMQERYNERLQVSAKVLCVGFTVRGEYKNSFYEHHPGIYFYAADTFLNGTTKGDHNYYNLNISIFDKMK
jgi:hypothetical protein